MPIQEDSHCRESIQSSEDCALDVAIEKDTVVSSSTVIQARMLAEFDKEILMVLPQGFC
tara:strand:+ start:320 stop:496 length:177 start_codon:yes stop_codon:yes gene_type:complete